MATNESWGPTHLIARGQIQRAVDASDAFDVVQRVLAEQARGRVAMPAKVTMNLAEFGLNAWNTAMPAYIESLGASGFKWVGGFSENRREHDLPFLIAMILVQDAQTGYPLGLLDGVHITNLRTGAVTALAVQKYAPPGARSLAQIGTGTQARFGVAAIRNIVDLEEIRAFDIDPDAAATFAREITEAHGIAVRICPDPESAVRGAEIVITATTSATPIVQRAWLAKGVTAISIGSQGQEFDDETVLGIDKLVCDFVGTVHPSRGAPFVCRVGPPDTGGRVRGDR